MGKIKIVVAIVAILLTGVLLIYLHRTETSKDSDTEVEEQEIILFHTDSDTPPKLAAYLEDVFTDLGWEMSDSREDSDIVTEYNPDYNTENDSQIHLFQVWILAQPFEEQGQGISMSELGIFPYVDSVDPTLLLGEKFSTLVPLETNSTPSSTFLTILQEVNSDMYTLPVEGYDPLDPATWSDRKYPLISDTAISGSVKHLEILEQHFGTDSFMSENGYLLELPSPDEFVTIVKTGTSVAGGPGWELCERTYGTITHPIDNVKLTLSSADITIISNESSFLERCSQEGGTTSFCGKPSYMQNLIDIGTDIVSLTGNHMCDYGKTPFSDTLTAYTQNNIQYFAGGANIQEAWTPLPIETNAGTVAFIGYNNMGPRGVIATDTLPGAASFDEASFASAMTQARESADIVWVDTHLWPEYWTGKADTRQLEHSNRAVDLGADIVTGVSSHDIHGYYFKEGIPIFLGLGNFLFDQMWSQETRDGIVLKVSLYEKKVRRIEVLPTTMYDWCQPRFHEGEEKKSALENFFNKYSL